MMPYTVNADLYDGPLALLVELARHNLLDVFMIKIQDLTAQYLALVKTGQTSLDELAEPLPLLGQLVALKARMLLPRPPVVEEEDAPVSLEELQQRLAQYEQFKNVAQVLAQLHALQHEYFSRMQSPEREALADSRGPIEAGPSAETPPAERAPDGGKELGLLDLMTAFTRVLDRAKAPIYEVVTDSWTVEMKFEELRLLLNVKKQLAFAELFTPDKARLELVVIFLALLELVRQRLCLAIQERTFGEIVIVKREPQA